MAGTEPTPSDESLQVATDIEERVGGRGPVTFWRLGLLGLLVLVAVLFALQWAGGNRQTDVQPGTPVAAPPSEASAS